MLGATGSGKSTFLGALQIALLKQQSGSGGSGAATPPRGGRSSR